MRAGTETQRF